MTRTKAARRAPPPAPKPRARKAGILSPPDPELLRSPVDYILAEHSRLEVVLDHLERLMRPAADGWPDIAAAVLDYLKRDLKWHVADEERDLFPILRQRALPTDRAEPIFHALSAEHLGDELLAEALVSGLEDALERGRGDSMLSGAAHAFVETQRRHLAWENATVLPLARLRLGVGDQALLCRRMARRRRLRHPTI